MDVWQRQGELKECDDDAQFAGGQSTIAGVRVSQELVSMAHECKGGASESGVPVVLESQSS